MLLHLIALLVWTERDASPGSLRNERKPPAAGRKMVRKVGIEPTSPGDEPGELPTAPLAHKDKRPRTKSNRPGRPVKLSANLWPLT